ncbi:alpha/beta hydrolase [Scleromatobacter humisilvae]|uniref:Alpha/beta hydrolase n=1 Tax=Scleromatobacter humisilvae TaxID=2897159 RepID=A0A9X2BZV4_9BURK|nr:alpha/beta hydrolase [Scleromatobacter humisilvae]MCK9687093.1 alpha/beta hydrolase [Scleromatobacter humisilvae]
MRSPCIDVLFIQGASDGAHAADRALADALGSALGDGFRVHFPHMPHEEAPDNDVWRRAISTALHRTPATFLVAHSAGAAIVADMLARGGEDAAALAALPGVLLLAPPFVGAGGWKLDGFRLDEPVQPETLAGLPLQLYFGSADTTVPPAHADLYARRFPGATIHRLPGCGHQFEGWMAHVARDVRALARA